MNISYPCETIEKRLVLKFPTIHDDNSLPYISLLTITRDRSEFLPLMIRNVLSCDYPKHLIEWVIIEDGPCRLNLCAIQAHLESTIRITYHHLGDLVFPIGFKRNIAVKMASHDILVHIDDDDYYPPESVIARVRSLTNRNMTISCVGCLSVRTFNLFTERTYEAYESSAINMSESSLAYKRDFWIDRRFENKCSHGEGINFVKNRYSQCRSLPHVFVITQFDHTKNTVKRFSNNTMYDTDNTVPFIETVDTETRIFVYDLRNSISRSMPETKEIIEFIKHHGSSKRASRLISNLSSHLQRHPLCLELCRNFPSTKIKAKRNSIVFYCGSGRYMTFLKKWDYENMDNIGGSEESVLKLAKCLSVKYWVSIYNERDDTKSFENGRIVFIPWYQFRPLDHCDIFVSWRDVSHFELFPNLKSNIRILDLHDLVPISWIPSDIVIDYILVKSHFHSDQCIPESLKSYVHVIPNIIEPLIETLTPINRREKIILSTSSPERCWYSLFRLADDITELYPEIVFILAYSYESIQQTTHWSVIGPLYKNNRTVQIKGHLPVNEVNVLYKRARMFVYPTRFCEVDCVSLSKAIEASCLCVHTSAGAMLEKSKKFNTYCVPVTNVNQWNETFGLDETEYESFRSVVISIINSWDDCVNNESILPSNTDAGAMWMSLLSNS